MDVAAGAVALNIIYELACSKKTYLIQDQSVKTIPKTAEKPYFLGPQMPI